MKIRDYQSEDYDFFTDMFYESIHITENKPPKQALLNDPALKKYTEDWGRPSDCALIAIGDDNQRIGAAWYRLFDENNQSYGFVNEETPELGIAVKEEARGQGAGAMLMKAIAEKARHAGYPAISLSVDPENADAVHLYEKLGYRKCGVSGTSWTMVLNF